MNLVVGNRLGSHFARLPLDKKAHIVCANALQIDWREVLPPQECSYIVGNPPFIGHQWRTAAQMAEMDLVWGADGRFGRLDYVACWHRKATEYMTNNPAIRTAFISTNSITQGEQVGILWSDLFQRGIKIHFAHRTFRWSNEGKGVAAVHCVIVGFGLLDIANKWIFDYDTPKSEPRAIKASNINAYLVDAPNIILPSRTAPPKGLPRLIKGSQPTDGGHLILTEVEKNDLLMAEPVARKWLRPYVGGEELINGTQRWCLWLKNIEPNELKSLPLVLKRVALVAESRRNSPTKSVRNFADTPTLFTQDRQPNSSYIAVPEVSSENRRFIPIGFLPSETITSNKLQIIEGGTIFHFAILNSTMYNAWMRTVCGRMKSDYSHSPAVYNNFPWPIPTDKQHTTIESAAQSVLNARQQFPDATLADLYDPLTMPPVLLKAHAALDKAVDTAYGYKGTNTDAGRVAFLFELYEGLTATR
jgi:hypothetical protein